MIELRWLCHRVEEPVYSPNPVYGEQPRFRSRKVRVLQYRKISARGIPLSDWQDVPEVDAPPEEDSHE